MNLSASDAADLTNRVGDDIAKTVILAVDKAGGGISDALIVAEGALARIFEIYARLNGWCSESMADKMLPCVVNGVKNQLQTVALQSELAAHLVAAGEQSTCSCCKGRRVVPSAGGPDRPCSRCRPEEFAQWYAARTR